MLLGLASLRTDSRSAILLWREIVTPAHTDLREAVNRAPSSVQVCLQTFSGEPYPPGPVVGENHH